jgi:hypothetical protein
MVERQPRHRRQKDPFTVETIHASTETFGINNYGASRCHSISLAILSAV